MPGKGQRVSAFLYQLVLNFKFQLNLTSNFNFRQSLKSVSFLKYHSILSQANDVNAVCRSKVYCNLKMSENSLFGPKRSQKVPKRPKRRLLEQVSLSEDAMNVNNVGWWVTTLRVSLSRPQPTHCYHLSSREWKWGGEEEESNFRTHHLVLLF